MCRGVQLVGTLVVVIALSPCPAHAADIVYDGSAADGMWTSGPNNPGAPAGANWTIDAGASGQVPAPDAGTPSGNSIDYLYSGHDWTIDGFTISEDVQIRLDGGSLDISNSNVSLLPSSANTAASLSGLNLGQLGNATTATFTNSTVNLSRANSAGRALGITNGSSLDLIGTTLNIAAETGIGEIDIDNPGTTLTIDATSSIAGGAGAALEVLSEQASVTLAGGSMDLGFIRLNSGGNDPQDLMFDFQGGTITLNDVNPLRDNSSFEGAFDWTGAAGSGTITHNNLGGSFGQFLAGKVAAGFFSIEGTRINPAVSSGLDWNVPANIDSLNTALSTQIVNSKFLQVTNTGSENVLELIASSQIQWITDADSNWNNGVNWSTDPTVPGATDDVLFSGTTITAPRTIDIDTAVVVNKLTVGGGNQYTFDDLSGGSLDVNEFSVGDGTHEIAAPLAGGNTTISGAGTLVLSADNSGFGGNIDIDSGTLQINSPNNLGSGPVNVNGTLRFEDGYDAAYSKNLTGSGEVVVNLLQTDVALDVETLDFTGNNSAYSGSIVVQEGRVPIDSSNDLGNTTGNTSITGSTGVLELDGSGGNITTAESFEIGSRGGNNFPGAELLPHLRNQAGNNTITGTVTTNGATFHNIETDAGTSLTINNTVDNPDGTLRFRGNGDVTIGGAGVGSGRLIGNGDVLKQGSGTLTIGTAVLSSDPADYHRGATTIEEGTVVVLSDGSNNGELQTSAITVRSGATFDVDDFGTYSLQLIEDPDETPGTGDEVGQTLTGAGTVVAQTLAVFDDSRVSPGDSVGTLDVTGNVRIATFNNIANVTGALSFELGDDNGVVGGSENDLLAISGNLDLSKGTGTNALVFQIEAVEGSFEAGNYTVITYGGTLTGNASGSDIVVSLQGVPQGTTRQTFSASSATAGEVNVVVAGSAESKTWVGNAANSTFWDVDTTGNWTGGTDNLYFNLDSVTFDDSAVSTSVALQADHAPQSVTFANTTKDYTLTGAGIVGATGITKNGAGTVTLGNAGNSYAGDTEVNAGTLVVTADHRGVTGDYTVSSGAKLQVGDGTNDGDLGDGANVTVLGELELRSTAEFLTQNLSGNGTVTVDGDFINLSGDNSAFSGTFNILSNGAQPRTPNPFGNAVAINLNGGDIRDFQGSNTATITSPINFNGAEPGNGSQIRVGGGGNTLILAGPISVNDTDGENTFRTDGNGPLLQVDGNVTLNAELRANNGSNSDTRVNGDVSGTGGIFKAGSGRLTLAGDSSYSGNTTVEAGSLILDASATLSNSAVIDVQSGATFNVSALASGFALSGGQTLMGEGAVSGDLVAGSSSTVSPGASPGTLTINGDYTQLGGSILDIELESLSEFDLLDVNGSLTAGGTLAVSLLSGFMPSGGDSFDILDFDSSSGSFAFSLPSLSAGLAWDTSSVLVDGVISVIAAGSADKDNDGDVDGADFLIIQRTNPAEIPLWESQYGTNVGPLGSLELVPEPSAFLLFGLALASSGAIVRRR